MHNAARIVTLNRYISLLQTEEKRLKWLTTSTSSANTENITAAANLKVVTEKLVKAERELAELGSRPRR